VVDWNKCRRCTEDAAAASTAAFYDLIGLINKQQHNRSFCLNEAAAASNRSIKPLIN
jgi:hypothetical protein